MIGLDQLAQQLSKTSRLQRVTELEVAGYVEEVEATGAFELGMQSVNDWANTPLTRAQRQRAPKRRRGWRS